MYDLPITELETLLAPEVNDFETGAGAIGGAIAGAASSVASGVSSVVAGAETAVSDAQSIMKNLGPFAIGAAFVLIGGALIVFAFGERIADVAEKVAEKVAPAAAAVGATAAVAV